LSVLNVSVITDSECWEQWFSWLTKAIWE